MQSNPITITDIESACDKVSKTIVIKEHSTVTHIVTQVDGLDSLQHEIALYLYACVAAHVDCSLRIVESLIGTTVDDRLALQNELKRLLIPPDPSKTDYFRVQHRDPWILEGIGHLMIKLSKNHPELGPPGEVKALTVLHDDVKDHGLDQVGMFTEQQLLSVNIGEAKASENGISAHIDATGKTFKEVRTGIHDFHIRGKIQQLRGSLPDDLQALITPSFWKNSQAFIAIAGYGSGASIDLNSKRVCYERVGLSHDRIRLIAIKLQNYKDFFEVVSNTLIGLA